MTGAIHPHAAPGHRPAAMVADAQGCELVLEDGSRVLDFGSSPSAVGHRHPKVVAAMHEAVGRPALGEAHQVRERDGLADELLERAFGGAPWAAAVRFCTTASEAVDLGLALSQALTGRKPLVARELAYHGAAGLAREASTYPLWQGALAGAHEGWRSVPSLAEVRRLPVPHCGAVGDPPCAGGASCGVHDVAESAAAFDGAAAVIADFGSGGIYPCGDYQDAVAERARDAGALWIADEAVTGFGRTGRWFAFERGSERPDMVVLGKGVTGGYAPGGVLVLGQRVVDLIDEARWLTFSTWRGHTLSLAAMRATLRVLDDDGLIRRASELGDLLANRLSALRSAHPSVVRVAGDGLVWNVDLDGPEHLQPAQWRGHDTSNTPAEAIHRAALKHGVMLRPMGALSLWIFPPLTVSEEQLGVGIDTIDRALTEVPLS